MGNATLQKLTEYQRTEAVDIRGYTLQQAVEYEIRWRRDLSTTHPDQHGGPAKINIGHTTYRLLAEQFGALTPLPTPTTRSTGSVRKAAAGTKSTALGTMTTALGTMTAGTAAALGAMTTAARGTAAALGNMTALGTTPTTSSR